MFLCIYHDRRNNVPVVEPFVFRLADLMRRVSLTHFSFRQKIANLEMVFNAALVKRQVF